MDRHGIIGGLLAVAVSLATATGLRAQEAAAPPPDQTFGPWSLGCGATADGETLCELRQIVGNEQGQEILRIAFGAAGDTGRELAIRTPQGVLLPAQVELAPLEAEAQITVAYRTCLNRSCFARTLIQDAELETLAQAAQPAVRFRDRSGRLIRVIISLEGLTEGLAALDAQ